MSDGPYGRHGFNANPGYGGAAGGGGGGGGGGTSYGNAGGGYAAPSYGQGYGGGASYAAPAPQDGGYGSQYGAYGGTESYQVGHLIVQKRSKVSCLRVDQPSLAL